MKVKARFKLGDREVKAEVINPGDYFARCKVIEVGGGFESSYFVVEADSEGDAIDELAESEKWGHLIAIDLETDGADYGYEVNPGDCVGGTEIEEKGWMNLKGEFITDESVGRYLNEPNTSGQGVHYDSDHIGLPQGWTDLVYMVELDEHGIKGTVDVKPSDWDEFTAMIDALTCSETKPAIIKGQLTFG